MNNAPSGQFSSTPLPMGGSPSAPLPALPGAAGGVAIAPALPNTRPDASPTPVPAFWTSSERIMAEVMEAYQRDPAEARRIIGVINQLWLRLTA